MYRRLGYFDAQQLPRKHKRVISRAGRGVNKVSSHLDEYFHFVRRQLRMCSQRGRHDSPPPQIGHRNVAEAFATVSIADP